LYTQDVLINVSGHPHNERGARLNQSRGYKSRAAGAPEICGQRAQRSNAATRLQYRVSKRGDGSGPVGLSRPLCAATSGGSGSALGLSYGRPGPPHSTHPTRPDPFPATVPPFTRAPPTPPATALPAIGVARKAVGGPLPRGRAVEVRLSSLSRGQPSTSSRFLPS
jgi:hypothetical protein